MSALARLALARPLATGATLVVVTALFAAGLPRLATDVGYHAFLGADHPAVRRFDAFLERFGGGLPLIAVWSCGGSPRDAAAHTAEPGAGPPDAPGPSPCANVFDPAALAMAQAVARALAADPTVARVASPATSALLVPGRFGLVPRRFVEDGRPAPDRARLAERAVADPLWVRRLVSPDGRTGAIVAELVSSSGADQAAAYASLDAALAPWEARGFRFARVGGPVEFVVAGGELERATARLVPVMVLLVGAVLLALFRSWSAAGVGLATVGVAVLWTLGLLGWLSAFGWAQNSLTQTLAPLVLVIGICDGMHVVAREAAERRAEGPDALDDRAARRRRLERVADDVGVPCLLTTLTTAAGFLSFTTAELESFARFGALAAFGVAAALVLTFSLMPLLLVALPSRAVAGTGASRVTALWERALGRWVELSRRRAGTILLLSLAAGGLGAWGMARLRVDASFEDLYGRDSRVVRWAHFVSERLRRPDTLEVQLTLPDGARLAEPRVLDAVDRVASELASVETLGPATSVVDAVRWTHRLVRDDDPAAQRRAATAEENDALLALASALGGEPGEDGLAAWADADRRRVRISVESEKTPQDVLRRVMTRVEDVLADLPSGWSGLATGPLAVVHDMIDAIRHTQLRSFATAGVAIWVLVAFALRSPAAATLAMIPTVLPVVVTLGVMGWVGLHLDVGSAMVAAVVLGVAVDDAVHLIEQYRRRRRAGRGSVAAIEGAVRHVGRAVVTTSVALAVGFAALALSPWHSVASFGLVASIAIAVALAAALGVLPAALVAAARAAARRRA